MNGNDLRARQQSNSVRRALQRSRFDAPEFGELTTTAAIYTDENTSLINQGVSARTTARRL
jgi:hypothetical protein